MTTTVCSTLRRFASLFGCARPFHQPPAHGLTRLEALAVWLRTCVAVQLGTVLLVQALMRWRRHQLTPFVILAMPRSGSTMLATALNAHGSISCAGEALNRRYEWYGDPSHFGPRRRRLHVRATLAACWLGSGLHSHCVGLKVLDEQLRRYYGQSAAPLHSLLADVGATCRVVLCVRHNLLESYVSLQRAHATGVWFREACAVLGNAAQDHGQGEHRLPQGQLLVSPADLSRHVRETRAFWRRAVAADAAACGALLVSYEELRCADARAPTLARLARHLLAGGGGGGAEGHDEEQQLAAMLGAACSCAKLEERPMAERVRNLDELRLGAALDKGVFELRLRLPGATSSTT